VGLDDALALQAALLDDREGQHGLVEVFGLE